MAEIKGTGLIQVLRALQGNRAVAETLIPIQLHGYFTQRVLASSWYPEADWAVLVMALGKMIAPQIEGDVWEYLGAQGAANDFNGIYASLVRKGDPWGSFGTAQKIWRLYRDTGRVEVKRDGPHKAQIFLYDYPFARPEICGTLTGYFRTLAEVSGATEVHVRLVRAQPPALGPSEWAIRFKG